MTREGAPLYLYGIIPTGTLGDPAPIGLDGAPVAEVADGPVAAVAGPARLRGGQVEATREHLQAHLETLRVVSERTTVVPMRFGMVAPDADSIRRQVLGPRTRQLQRLLRDLDGMIEVDVKAYFREEAVLPELVRENPSIRDLDARIRRRSGPGSYQDRIRLGEMVVAALRRKAEREGHDLMRRLARTAARAQAGALETERMVLNAAFLIPRTRLGSFDRAVEGVTAESGDRLLVRAVGPLPPASFASLEDAADRRGRRGRAG